MFFGTPDWAVPSLESLLRSEIDVAAVVTNPDRPAGRGMQLRASPVKTAALASGIPVWQPSTARDPELHDRLRAATPDVATVVAYGKILPASLLAVPRLGFVNLHFSLLPLYRGAAPVQRAVIDGAVTTGASIMVLTEGMDEGPVLATVKTAIQPDESAGELGTRLAALGADLLAASLVAYSVGELEPVEQDHSAATYAPKLTDEEARVDWSRPGREIANLIRGCDPAPGAWTMLQGTRLKLYRPRVAVDDLPAGRLDASVGLRIGAGDGTAVEIGEAQLAGKRRMAAADLARGLRLEPGEGLE